MNAPITQMNSELLREMRKAQVKKTALDGLRVLAIIALDQINKRRPFHEGSPELAEHWLKWAEQIEPLLPEDFGDQTPEQALKDSLDWLLEPTCAPSVDHAALLKEAGELFRVYEQSHLAKGPGHEEKAARNREIAEHNAAVEAKRQAKKLRKAQQEGK